MIDTGETLRWVIQVDGREVSDLDVRVEKHPERPGVMVMLLVRGGEEVELAAWSTERQPYGPASVSRTLRELRP